MTAALGWYGPLIDLSECGSYMGHYVQLIVFVHTTTPIQKFKSPREEALLRTHVQIGDDTRSYFPLTIWNKNMGSTILPGDVILLQNVKIVKFGDTIEAGTVQFSSLVPLVHPYELLMSKGVDDLLSCCQVGIITKEKLKKVIKWVQQARAAFHNVQQNTHQKKHAFKNWKPQGERKYYGCTSVSEVSSLTISCVASFYALVGDIFLPSCKVEEQFDKERMFISRRLLLVGDNELAEELICLGCKLCGYPVDFDSGSLLVQNRFPLYCLKSSNRHHTVCRIYRPFLLYVWDQSECIPLHVTNNAAELLFGSITAERVYSCYEEEKKDLRSYSKNIHVEGHCDQRASSLIQVGGEHLSSQDANGRLQSEINLQIIRKKKSNFYRIWLILLKVLLQQGKNSSLRFEVTINSSINDENGRFGLVSVAMPCTKTN